MQQAADIRDAVSPDEILFVVDAMIGQDAVNTAEAFRDGVGFDGVVLSKLDGDARGGAALSIRQVTGKPIMFASNGEKLDDFDAFHPDRMASRILDMGDLLTLIEQAEKTFSQEEAERMASKLASKKGQDFTLDDFLAQMEQVRKMGSISKLLGMLPGMGQIKDQINNLDERDVDRTAAIIKSMTPGERQDPTIINGSRRARIAKGSGVEVSAVKNLVERFFEARKMMSRMAQGGGMPGMPGMPGMGGGPGRGKKKQKQAKGKQRSGNPMKRKQQEQEEAAAPRGGCPGRRRLRSAPAGRQGIRAARRVQEVHGLRPAHERRRGALLVGGGAPAAFGVPCVSGHARDEIAEHVRHPHGAVRALVGVEGLGQLLVDLHLVGGGDRRVEQTRRLQAPYGAVGVRVAEGAGHPSGAVGPQSRALGDPLQVVALGGAPGVRAAQRFRQLGGDPQHRRGGAALRRAPAGQHHGRPVPGQRQRLGEQFAQSLRVAGEAPDRFEGGHHGVPGGVAGAASGGSPARSGRRCAGVVSRSSGSSRSRARASRSDEVSTPVIAAPREAAISRASPEPQPRPSSRVAGPTSSRSYTAS